MIPNRNAEIAITILPNVPSSLSNAVNVRFAPSTPVEPSDPVTKTARAVMVRIVVKVEVKTSKAPTSPSLIG